MEKIIKIIPNISIILFIVKSALFSNIFFIFIFSTQNVTLYHLIFTDKIKFIYENIHNRK